MLEMFGKFVEFVLLLFYIDFRVIEEEYFREDGVFEPETSHPFVAVVVSDG